MFVGFTFKFNYFSPVKKILHIVLLLTLVTACSYDKYRYNFFEGNWVLINYLDTVEKYRSVDKASHVQMQEIILKRHLDTVTFLYDNMESERFPFFHKTSNQIVIDNYINLKPLSIYINEQAYYLSYKIDSVQYVFVKPDDRLIDSSAQGLPPYSTQRVINSLVLGGIYKQENNNIPVQFYTNGNISGLKDFTYYQTCIGGDCRTFYDGDVVLMSGQNGTQYYTWEWKGNYLTIFELIKTTLPDEKPHYLKGKSVIALHKIK
jgi:hypothetical protein